MKYQIFFCLIAICLLIGSVSADTLIVYTSNTIDGMVMEGTDATFPVLRLDVGESVVYDADYQTPRLVASTTSNIYNYMRRGVAQYNTSSIPDDATITSATLSLFGDLKTNGLGSPGIGITAYSPYYVGGALAITDYDSFGNDRYAPDIPYNSWSTIKYNNFSFSTAGLANISKTSWTPIMMRLAEWDIDNNTAGLTWASGAQTYIAYMDTGNAGTDKDPFMTIEFTTGGATPPVASFTVNKNFIRIPNTVTVTDTSTNTPTSWEWSWGDGTANSTTQNPSHQYLKRGKWDIVMTATNAGGSSTTAATSERVTGYETYN